MKKASRSARKNTILNLKTIIGFKNNEIQLLKLENRRLDLKRYSATIDSDEYRQRLEQMEKIYDNLVEACWKIEDQNDKLKNQNDRLKQENKELKEENNKLEHELANKVSK